MDQDFTAKMYFQKKLLVGARINHNQCDQRNQWKQCELTLLEKAFVELFIFVSCVLFIVQSLLMTEETCSTWPHTSVSASSSLIQPSVFKYKLVKISTWVKTSGLINLHLHITAPIVNIFDLIVHQLGKRLKTLKNASIRGENFQNYSKNSWCKKRKNCFKPLNT